MRSKKTQEGWEITKKIKTHFIKHGTAPPTELLFYKIGTLIGKGSFGKVNLGLHKLTRKMVAIKSINRDRLMSSDLNADNAISRQNKKINNEFNIMSRLYHENIVKCYEKLDTPTHSLFIMELCQGGNLLNYIRRRQRLTEAEARHFFDKLINGIAYIHNKNIIHGDIKLENILLDNKGEVKICDFGISKSTDDADADG